MADTVMLKQCPLCASWDLEISNSPSKNPFILCGYCGLCLHGVHIDTLLKRWNQPTIHRDALKSIEFVREEI